MKFPIHNDNYTLSKYAENNTNFIVPLEWISPAFPINKTLRLKYTFKYKFYVNCSDNALGYLKVGLFGYRNGKETENCLVCSGLSPTIRNSSSPQKLIWYKDIEGSIKIKKGDRVVLRIVLLCLIEGRFWLGLDCEAYPSCIVDPETETLRPESTTYNPAPVSAYFGIPETSNSSLHKATDDITPDNDYTYTSTRAISCPPYGCYVTIATYRLGLPNGVIPSGSSINSVTHFFLVRREVVPWGNIMLGIYIDTTYDYDSWAHPPISYSSYNKEWLQNPSTGQNWTLSDIDSVELACKLYGATYLGFYLWTRCTQHYLVVEYVSPPAINWALRWSLLFFFVLIAFVLIVVIRNQKK